MTSRAPEFWACARFVDVLRNFGCGRGTDKPRKKSRAKTAAALLDSEDEAADTAADDGPGLFGLPVTSATAAPVTGDGDDDPTPPLNEPEETPAAAADGFILLDDDPGAADAGRASPERQDAESTPAGTGTSVPFAEVDDGLPDHTPAARVRTVPLPTAPAADDSVTTAPGDGNPGRAGGAEDGPPSTEHAAKSASEDSGSESEPESDASTDAGAPNAKPLLHEVSISKSSGQQLGFDLQVRLATKDDGCTGVYALVRAVTPGGLAQKSGVRAGDRIVQIGHMRLDSVYHTAQCIELFRESQISLVLKRDGAVTVDSEPALHRPTQGARRRRRQQQQQPQQQVCVASWWRCKTKRHALLLAPPARTATDVWPPPLCDFRAQPLFRAFPSPLPPCKRVPGQLCLRRDVQQRSRILARSTGLSRMPN